MRTVTVEYKRSRGVRGFDRSTMKQLPRSRNKIIKPHPWNTNPHGGRDVEARARDVVRRYPLIEDALAYAWGQMAKYEEDSDDQSMAFWRGVYKWLRRHEDKIRFTPHLVGV